MSHVSASQGGTLEASGATPGFGGSGVEVGACNDGLCDPLAIDIVGRGVGYCGPTHQVSTFPGSTDDLHI